jgi:hypothetical protein
MFTDIYAPWTIREGSEAIPGTIVRWTEVLRVLCVFIHVAIDCAVYTASCGRVGATVFCILVNTMLYFLEQFSPLTCINNVWALIMIDGCSGSI